MLMLLLPFHFLHNLALFYTHVLLSSAASLLMRLLGSLRTDVNFSYGVIGLSALLRGIVAHLIMNSLVFIDTAVIHDVGHFFVMFRQ